MNGLFLCEFEEVASELRDETAQGGGVHGNAGELSAGRMWQLWPRTAVDKQTPRSHRRRCRKTSRLPSVFPL
jgi:hypothetical protein